MRVSFRPAGGFRFKTELSALAVFLAAVAASTGHAADFERTFRVQGMGSVAIGCDKGQRLGFGETGSVFEGVAAGSFARARCAGRLVAPAPLQEAVGAACERSALADVEASCETSSASDGRRTAFRASGYGSLLLECPTGSAAIVLEAACASPSSLKTGRESRPGSGLDRAAEVQGAELFGLSLRAVVVRCPGLSDAVQIRAVCLR